MIKVKAKNFNTAQAAHSPAWAPLVRRWASSFPFGFYLHVTFSARPSLSTLFNTAIPPHTTHFFLPPISYFIFPTAQVSI